MRRKAGQAAKRAKWKKSCAFENRRLIGRENNDLLRKSEMGKGTSMSINAQNVAFSSDGLTIRGELRLPGGSAPDTKLSAFIILHGFGGTREGRDVTTAAAFYNELGYATLAFDFRGCGESEGERGRLICLEQVQDTQNAISFLQEHSAIASDRIALTGSSFGAAVAVYTGGVDKRVAAVLSNGGWGNGERKFRGQHSTPEAWEKFTGLLKAGVEHKANTGTSLMISRFDIVPIPEHLRKGLPPGSIMSFPAETPQSMFDFRPDDVVASIAPRPLMLTHASRDTVTPTDLSLELFRRAGQPADLHLFADIDHFNTFDDVRMRGVLQPWLERYFPPHAIAAEAS